MNSRNDPLSLQLLINGEIYQHPSIVTSRTNELVTDLLADSMDASLKREEIEAGLGILSGLYEAIGLIEEGT